MPSPARNTGTTTTSAPTRRPSAAPSGVWTVIGVAVVGGAVATYALTQSDNIGIVFHR